MTQAAHFKNFCNVIEVSVLTMRISKLLTKEDIFLILGKTDAMSENSKK